MTTGRINQVASVVAGAARRGGSRGPGALSSSLRAVLAGARGRRRPGRGGPFSRDLPARPARSQAPTAA